MIGNDFLNTLPFEGGRTLTKNIFQLISSWIANKMEKEAWKKIFTSFGVFDAI